MVKRGELTDKAWAQITPLLPENGRPSGRWRDHRTVVNGILWKLRTGALWRDLPERYGPWQTCYDHFSRWRRDGTWDRLLADAQAMSDAVGEVEWLVSVDCCSRPNAPVSNSSTVSSRGWRVKLVGACYSQITHVSGLRFYALLANGEREVRFERASAG